MIEKRKCSMPTFRFRHIAYMDAATKILQPPTGHHQMVKGALVMLTIKNHLWVSKIFARRAEGSVAGVEEMFYLYPQYGDTIKVISGPKAATSVVAPSKDANEVAKLIGGLNISQLLDLIAQSKLKEAAAAKNVAPVIAAQANVGVEEFAGMPEEAGLSDEDLEALASCMEGFPE